MLTKEQQKANAVENLRKIKCYAPYLKAFKNGTITMYEGFGGYYVDVEDYGNGQYAVMSYVWNKTYDDCSEFGSVVIKPALGGLVRVA